MKRLSICLLMLALFCSRAYAATAEDLQYLGTCEWNATDVSILDRIPLSVVELHRLKGGRVIFIQSPIERDQGILGIYYFRSKDIYIRVWSGWPGGYSRTLAHEYGHFLYHETGPSWPRWVRDEIEPYGDEGFAEAYATYCTSGSTWSQDLTSAIKEINTVAERLLMKEKGVESNAE